MRDDVLHGMDKLQEVFDYLIETFHTAWDAHIEFCRETPLAATPYRAEGWSWPGTPSTPGLKASVAALANHG